MADKPSKQADAEHAPAWLDPFSLGEKLGELAGRLLALERRMDVLERQLTQLRDDMNQRFANLEAHINQRFASLEAHQRRLPWLIIGGVATAQALIRYFFP